ncbi:MAG TPA: DUF47 family protein [Actinomycetota bacterium]
MKFRLIPREESFYDLFIKQAEILVQATEVFRGIVTEFTDVKRRARRVHDLEHEGDEVTHEVMRRLNTTFVTPIDREDVHELASNMDDVLDHMDAAIDFLVLHNIDRPIQEMKAQIDLLSEAAKATLEAMQTLPAFDRLSRYWIEINRLENEADRVYRQGVADLFSGEFEAMEVLRWKDIIDQLEKAMDKLEDVANTLEGIALKQA